MISKRRTFPNYVHFALVTALILSACGGSPSTPSFTAKAQSHDPSFESYWQDGKAEMNGYEVTVLRYGEERVGEGVMIYVTEPFSLSKRVKANDANANPKDTVEILKLNFVRDFQTGVYDYNTMSSIFSRSSDFNPLKISFSSAEWCGHVYDEVILDKTQIHEKYFSYFEDETIEQTLDRPENGITEENLYILLRGLRGEFLGAGKKITAPFLSETFYRRLAHKKTAWVDATITRSSNPEPATVPAGTFTTDRYDIELTTGRSGSFWIESDYPHRIVKWAWKESPDAKRRALGGGTTSGVLTGTKRMPYWSLHNKGDESRRKEMGLSSLP